MDQNERYSVPNKSETDVFCLPVTHRIQYKVSTIYSNSISGTAPHYLSDLLQPYTPTRQLRSASYTQTSVTPRVNTKTSGERSFSYAGPFKQRVKKSPDLSPAVYYICEVRPSLQPGRQTALWRYEPRYSAANTTVCTKPGPIIISLCVDCGP